MENVRVIGALKRVHCLVLFTLLLGFASLVQAKSCFDDITYVEPEKQMTKRALYILIDETVPLSKVMKKKISNLLSGWGKQGDKVKIARFSASYRGLYPELVYDERVEQLPDEQYMFNLRYKDKKGVVQCLDEQRMQFKENFAKQLKASLNTINPGIPKSELMGSLKLLSKQLILKDEAQEKVVLLISDGLENSALTSFYSNGKLKNIKPKSEISKLRRKGMMGYWKNTKVYMYGLGLLPDKKQYINPERITSLKRFWGRYFVEGGGRIKEIGTPELLLTAID